MLKDAVYDAGMDQDHGNVGGVVRLWLVRWVFRFVATIEWDIGGGVGAD